MLQTLSKTNRTVRITYYTIILSADGVGNGKTVDYENLDYKLQNRTDLHQKRLSLFILLPKKERK